MTRLAVLPVKAYPLKREGSIDYEYLVLKLQLMLPREFLVDSELKFPLTTMDGELIPFDGIIKALYDPNINDVIKHLCLRNGAFRTQWRTLRYGRVIKKVNRARAADKLEGYAGYIRDLGKSMRLDGDIVITDPYYFLKDNVDTLEEAGIRGLESTTVYGDWSCHTFEVGKRAARTGRNPKTGEAIKIKAAKSPKFKAGKALKDIVNKK